MWAPNTPLKILGEVKSNKHVIVLNIEMGRDHVDSAETNRSYLVQTKALDDDRLTEEVLCDLGLGPT